VFALLTGYRQPPLGAPVPDGLHYNPYFPGGGIAMAQSLYEDVVEYDDGTPATPSQYARDVVEFLNWVAEPELEQRKRMGLKAMILMGALLLPALYYKRLKFSVIKNRVVKFTKPRKWRKD
jgi:ubiquinol-cytochrome c reductase cytochrome c1 subunit